MTKKSLGFSLKDQLFNKHKVEYLSGLIKNVYPDFLHLEFEEEILKKFPELELKQRISHITDMLNKYLPKDYKKALEIILKSLPEEIITEVEDNNFWDFIFCPYWQFVATYGCSEEYLKDSFDALADMTIRFSAEDAIRYFYNEFEQETLEKMLEWSTSDNYHHRRLSSEWSRAKLPWCQKINLHYKEPIAILDNLYYDSSRYVTRSVANHLNDISKLDPDLVIDTLKKWKKSGKWQDLDYIISHSTRTLIKAWDKKTLEFLGYSSNPKIKITNFKLENKNIKIWESLDFSFDIFPLLTSPKGRGIDQEKLIIDYKIHFLTKNGELKPKVFKIKKLDLVGKLNISKKHPLKLMTTKALYPWTHYLELWINWVSFWKKSFELTLSLLKVK